MSATNAFLTRRPIYFWLILIAPGVVAFANHVAPGQILLKGHSVALVIGLCIFALAGLAWIPFRSKERWTWLGKAALAGIFVTGTSSLIRIQNDGGLFDLLAIAFLASLLMIAFKPPSLHDSLIGSTVFAYSVICVAFTAQILDLLAVGPPTGEANENGDTRIPLVSQVIGLEGRWGGPFDHSNYAGPIGGALLILAIGQRGTNRIVIALSGVIFLMLSQSRSGVIATCAGLLVYLLTSRRVRAFRRHRIIQWSTVAVFIGGVMTYILLADPTLAWRTYAWMDFADLWRVSPWLGVGDSGVNSYINGEPVNGPVTFTHSHNMLLEPLTRYGVLAALLVVTTLAVTGWLARQAQVSSGISVGLALFIFFLTLGIVEVPFAWTSLSVLMTPLILCITISASACSQVQKILPDHQVVQADP